MPSLARGILLDAIRAALGSRGNGNLAASFMRARRCSNRRIVCQLLTRGQVRCSGSRMRTVRHVHLRSVGFRGLWRLSGLAGLAPKMIARERTRKITGGRPGGHRQKENGEQSGNGGLQAHRPNSTAAPACGLPFSRAFEDNNGVFGAEEIGGAREAEMAPHSSV